MTDFSRIQLRQDTAANWEEANTLLAAGEEAIDLTSGRKKRGNGVDRWNTLPFETTVEVQAEIAEQLRPAAETATAEAAAAMNPIPALGPTPGKIVIQFGEGNTTEEFDPFPASYDTLLGRPAQLDRLVNGPVLDNAGPKLIYSDSLHNGFPHMIRRSDGLLIAVWRRGSTHSGGKGQIRRAFSNDNGMTWRNAAGLSSSASLESSSDQVQIDALLDSRDACLTELSDGRIVMAYFLRQWNPYAWDSDTVVCIRISSDGGVTFDPEVQLPDTFTNYVGHSSPVVELPGGVVWKTIFGSSTDDAIGGDGTVVTYMTSTLDTMHEPEGWVMAPEPIHDGVSGGLTSESNVILNSAGDGVIAAVRFDDLKQTRVYHKPLSGGSWTQVGSFSALSTPRMFRTASGRILVPYRRGEGYEGVGRSALAWSDDDGITWGGVNASPLYLDDMSTHRFAYAGLAEVRPGACVVVYGSEREGDEQGEVWSRPLAVHPVNAPTRLEVPVAPWTSGSGGETLVPISGARVYYNAVKDNRADGASLIRWTDLSGNNLHITPSASPPVYDVDEEGRCCLLFDGVDDYLDIPAVLGDSLWRTIVIAVERLDIASGSNVQVLLTTRPSTSSALGWELQWRGTDARLRHSNGSGSPHLQSALLTSEIVAAPLVAAFSASPDVLSAGLAGLFTATASGISYTTSGGSVTRIGQSVSGSSIPFKGRLYGLQIFERAMSDAELARQARWLAQECSISNSGW